VTLYWTDPDNIEPYDDTKGYVRIYHNAGNPAKPYPDYDTLVDSVLAGVEQWTSGPLCDGTWAFGLRVYDGVNEELNGHTFVIFRVVNGEVFDTFPPKPALLADPSIGGKVTLLAMIDASTPLSYPSTVKFFTNDGAGGAVDYSTELDEVSVTEQGSKYLAELLTAAYGETERIFGAIAYDADGNPSMRAAEVTVTPDATAPEAIPDIEIEETRI